MRCPGFMARPCPARTLRNDEGADSRLRLPRLLGAAFSDGGRASSRGTAVAGGRQEVRPLCKCPPNLDRTYPIKRLGRTQVFEIPSGVVGISFTIHPGVAVSPALRRAPAFFVVAEAVARPAIDLCTGSPSPPAFAFAPAEGPPSH
ncbi:hypothetical protein PAHAL_9G033700 [Panicum hallii]|jgi:hypothetical protein|uniref:Uncharacterized protein n=1 Tax=Panicum hallii TaxID=206008 RepID=A0A2T8I003_9POAL|nr:hypothetical protein PAHAL_9G033700 [Panicum hallii]